jgi:hypothetical protein
MFSDPDFLEIVINHLKDQARSVNQMLALKVKKILVILFQRWGRNSFFIRNSVSSLDIYGLIYYLFSGKVPVFR